GKFNTPTGVAIDRSGKIYVADSCNSRVEKFFPNGTFISAWNVGAGNPGIACSGPLPTGIGIDNSNNIYVTDSFNNIVQKYDNSGTPLSWGPYPSFNSPTGITTDSSNNVYVADSGNNRIEKFTGSGTLLAILNPIGSNQFSYPKGVGLDSAG